MQLNLRPTVAAVVLVIAAAAIAMLSLFDIADTPVLLMLLVVAGYALLVKRYVLQNASAALEANSMFLVLFGAYVVLPPSLAIFFPDNELVSDYVKHLAGPSNLQESRAVAWCSLLAVAGTAVGLAFAPQRQHRNLAFLDNPWQPQEANLLAAALIGLGTSLLVLLFYKMGGAAYLEYSYVETYAAEDGLGYLSAGALLIQLGLYVLYLNYISSTSPRKTPWMVLLVFAVLLLLSLRTGRRRPIMEAGIGLLVLRHFYVAHFRPITLAAGSAAVLLLFAIVGQARTVMKQGLSAMVDFARNDFSLEDTRHLMMELYTTTLTTNRTISMLESGNGEQRYGMTYLEAFEILIPKALHPERPLAPSQWFVWEVDPYVASQGGGYSYSLIAEGYLNFGYLGVFFTSIAVAVLVQMIVAMRRDGVPRPGRMLFYAVFCASLVSLVRGDFASLLKTYVVTTGVPTLLACVWLGRRHFTGSTRVARPNVLPRRTAYSASDV